MFYRLSLLVLGVVISAACTKSDPGDGLSQPVQAPNGTPQGGRNAPVDFGATPGAGTGTATGSGIRPGLGFYPITHPGLPAEALRVAGSVLAIRTLGATTEKDLIRLDASQIQGYKVKVQHARTDKRNEMDRIVTLKQIEQCEIQLRADPTQPCFIANEIHSATGFLLGSGNLLWTNAHVINPELQANAKYRGTPVSTQLQAQQLLRVFAFDLNGRLVLDPYVNRVSVKHFPRMTARAQQNGDFYAEDSDWIGLQLSQAIGQPLERATTPLMVGQNVFVLGYPACTGCPVDGRDSDPLDFTDRGPLPNSDGFGLKFSSGETLSFNLAFSFFDDGTTWKNVLRLDQLFFYSADSHLGLSGGPVFNEQGQVVGIHAGGKSRMNGNAFMHISRAVLF